jgi:hypothetical protein
VLATPGAGASEEEVRVADEDRFHQTPYFIYYKQFTSRSRLEGGLPQQMRGVCNANAAGCREPKCGLPVLFAMSTPEKKTFTS